MSTERARDAVGAMRETSGLLWQGLNVDQAVEAFRRRFGKLPSVFMAHTGDKLTGAAVPVTYRRNVPKGHIWLPLGPAGDLRLEKQIKE